MNIHSPQVLATCMIFRSFISTLACSSSSSRHVYCLTMQRQDRWWYRWHSASSQFCWWIAMFGAGNQCPLWVLTTDPKVPWPVTMMAINSSLAKVCKDGHYHQCPKTVHIRPRSMYIGTIAKWWLLEERKHSAKKNSAKCSQWDFNDRYYKWFATLFFDTLPFSSLKSSNICSS